MYFAYYINWPIRLFFVNWSNIHTQRIVGLLILFRCVGAYKIFVAPTFVCIHFVVHYWQSLVLFSSFSGPNPPHQWSSETFIITLLPKVWSRHAGQRNPLTAWNMKNHIIWEVRGDGHFSINDCEKCLNEEKCVCIFTTQSAQWQVHSINAIIDF